MKSVIIAQFIILLMGVLFAWGNFIYELYHWLNNKVCTTGCAQGLANPFLTPCFYGALFFTISFVLSVILVLKIR